MNIKEMSTKYEIPMDTLRYYEKIGLLIVKREEDKRVYDEQNCADLEFILTTRNANVPIELIRNYLVACRQEREQGNDVEQSQIISDILADIVKYLDNEIYKFELFRNIVQPMYINLGQSIEIKTKKAKEKEEKERQRRIKMEELQAQKERIKEAKRKEREARLALKKAEERERRLLAKMERKKQRRLAKLAKEKELAEAKKLAEMQQLQEQQNTNDNANNDNIQNIVENSKLNGQGE